MRVKAETFSKLIFTSSCDCQLEAPLLSKNACKSHHCVSCCNGTEMFLLEADVQTIVSLGFKESSFSVESDGFKMLRNNSNNGRCIFHDGKRCTIYSNRPAGCRLYPVIFDEDLDHPVRDGFCPYKDEFDLSSKVKRELLDVYLKLIDERKRRHASDSGCVTSGPHVFRRRFHNQNRPEAPVREKENRPPCPHRS